MINLANEPARSCPKSKSLYNQPQKPSQRQMGAITPKVDRQLKVRSGGICELRKRCDGAFAVQRAHITARGKLKRRTTVNDLLHCCLDCHNFLDRTVEGIRYKRELSAREISR